MYKIAGELLPCVMHVAARALAGQALSIFGDHSDVMACRSTGWAMLASESVEMAQVNAIVSHLVSMERRVPVQHFFDGFRTSHEVNKVKLIDYNTMKTFINWEAVKEHHDLAMNPRHPHVQGTSQGPDIFFQCVEAGNSFYDGLADLFEEKGKMIQEKTGLHFALYGYEGHPEAKHVIVVMGSGAITCGETANFLSKTKGQRVGVLKVRLFRPWDSSRFLAALPKTTERICVLDRTKEPGSQGEPLLLEVNTMLQLSARSEIVVVGGRYGLGSKEFTPNMVLSIYENLAKPDPKPRFTVGINDDVTFLSLPVGPWLNVLPEGTTECMFYGLGSDGTVGANKSAVKMIALGTELHAQAGFLFVSFLTIAFQSSNMIGRLDVNMLPYILVGPVSALRSLGSIGFQVLFDSLNRPISSMMPRRVVVLPSATFVLVPSPSMRHTTCVQPTTWPFTSKAM